MKIAVVGCGAVGSYYGGLLCRAGHDVHFLLRSDYEAVRRQGLLVHSASGDFHARPRCAREPGQIGPAALVLIALKTTANALLPALLPPLIGPDSAVLTLQNGLGTEAAAAAVAGAQKTLGGLCFVCLNRVAPGIIHHVAHGAVVLGEFGRPSQQRTRDIAAAIAHSGVACQVTDNLEQAHWEKLVWNIPFNGLGVASAAGIDAVRRGSLGAEMGLQPCLSTDQLLADPDWAQLTRQLMLETIDAAQARGLPVAASLADRQIARTRSMGAYKASTVLDYEQGRDLELETLFLEPLRQARQAGVAAPRLGALCEVLRHLVHRQSAARQQISH
jgi:2-dehydropantoate 2-reductase